MMSDHIDRDRARVRFNVSPDGSVEGDDGAGGQLAGTLRYVCRMGSQIGTLLEIGELERLSTLSPLSLLARVGGVSPHLSIKAEVETQQTSRPEPIVVSGIKVQEAIKRSLRRVTKDLASDWTALITDDMRLVGAVHYEPSGQAAPPPVFEVGLRALAVLGALDERLRETAVRLDYVRGSVLIAAMGEHALFTQAHKFEVSEVVTSSVGAAQGLLAGVELASAPTISSSRRL